MIRSPIIGQFSPPPSDWVDGVILTANTAHRHPIPQDAAYALISLDGDFYAKIGNEEVTASLVTETTTNGTASEYSPVQRRIPEGASHISLIADGSRRGTISFYR